MAIGKALAIVGATAGAYTILDKALSGKFFWEKPPFVPAVQPMQTQALIRMQVQSELANRERARLQKEKSEVMKGRYASDAGWTTPQTANYGLSHY